MAAPVLLVANKVDDASHEALVWDLMSLGLGEPFPVSALHGRGTGDLLDSVIGHFRPTPEEANPPRRSTRAARSVPSPWSVAPTSASRRSSIDSSARNVPWSTTCREPPGTRWTRWWRPRSGPCGSSTPLGCAASPGSTRAPSTSRWCRALKAVDTADVALLVIDATEGVTHQDQRLAERVDGAGCPIVVLLNKWELLDEDERRDVLYQMGQRLHFLGDSAVLRISALTGRGVHRLLPGPGERHRRLPHRGSRPDR